MKPFPIAAATAAAVVGSALALGQDPLPVPPQGTTATKTEAKTATPGAPPAAGASGLKDLKARSSYVIGYDMIGRLKAQGIEIDADAFLRGVRDVQAGTKPALTEAEIQEAMQAAQQQATAKQAEMQKAMQAEAAKAGDAAKKEGDAFLAANAKKPGVVTLPSGLQYRVEQEGAGKSPKLGDAVTVHYEGRLVNGQVFDSSYRKGEPVAFQLQRGGLIAGWVEALPLMKTGAKWELYIPGDLGYGPRGHGPTIPPNTTLIFKVELLLVNGQK